MQVEFPFSRKFIETFSSKNASISLLVGGDKWDRTADLLLARQALSQLSYAPKYFVGGPKWTRTTDLTIISRVL